MTKTIKDLTKKDIDDLSIKLGIKQEDIIKTFKGYTKLEKMFPHIFTFTEEHHNTLEKLLEDKNNENLDNYIKSLVALITDILVHFPKSLRTKILKDSLVITNDFLKRKGIDENE